LIADIATKENCWKRFRATADAIEKRGLFGRERISGDDFVARISAKQRINLCRSFRMRACLALKPTVECDKGDANLPSELRLTEAGKLLKEPKLFRKVDRGGETL
jgi:hypothetical protein